MIVSLPAMVWSGEGGIAKPWGQTVPKFTWRLLSIVLIVYSIFSLIGFRDWMDGSTLYELDESTFLMMLFY